MLALLKMLTIFYGSRRHCTLHSFSVSLRCLASHMFFIFFSYLTMYIPVLVIFLFAVSSLLSSVMSRILDIIYSLFCILILYLSIFNSIVNTVFHDSPSFIFSHWLLFLSSDKHLMCLSSSPFSISCFFILFKYYLYYIFLYYLKRIYHVSCCCVCLWFTFLRIGVFLSEDYNPILCVQQDT